MRALRALVSAGLALLILFEPWGWEPLRRALARLGRLQVARRSLQRRWARLRTGD